MPALCHGVYLRLAGHSSSHLFRTPTRSVALDCPWDASVLFRQLTSVPSLYCKSGDCRLEPWSVWSRCSVSCGMPRCGLPFGVPRTRLDHPLQATATATAGGTQAQLPTGNGTALRTRTVISPSKNAGSACNNTLETTPCDRNVCPKDCALSSWSATDCFPSPFLLC